MTQHTAQQPRTAGLATRWCFETFDVQRNGATYRVCHAADVYADAPWVNWDGSGIVSDWTQREKKPGELVLSSDRKSKRFYDFSATMKKAKTDGWGISGDTTGMSRNEISQRAVMLDFERMRDWCSDKWSYIIVVVFPLTPDGDELKSKAKRLFGVESDCENLDELALELVAEFEDALV